MAAIYFTKAQIEEIQQRLAVLGSKDSKLPRYETPLTKDEIFAIVQNGANRKIPLQDVLNMATTNTVIVTHKDEIDPTYVPEQSQVVITIDDVFIDSQGDEVEVSTIKIGDGTVPYSDLPTVNEYMTQQIVNHITDISMHVSDEDREWWEKHMDATYDESNERMNLFYTDRFGNNY